MAVASGAPRERVADDAPDAGAEALVERVQQLTAELETIEDEAARQLAEELMGAVMALYGEGLERTLEALTEAGEAGAAVRAQLAEDGVVGSLMLIHGLYPVELETRVREALDSVRPYLESHEGNVELLKVQDGVAHLKLQGSCSGCSASAATLELAIKRALEETAPDLLGLEVEGVVEKARPKRRAKSSLNVISVDEAGESSMSVELPVASNGSLTPTWLAVDGVGLLPKGGLAAVSVEPDDLIVANVGGTLLAYRNACAWCRCRLDGATLSGGTLSCPSCERRFDLPRAGRSPDDESLQLEPIPLLRDGSGAVRVALAR